MYWLIFFPMEATGEITLVKNARYNIIIVAFCFRISVTIIIFLITRVLLEAQVHPALMDWGDQRETKVHTAPLAPRGYPERREKVVNLDQVAPRDHLDHL